MEDLIYDKDKNKKGKRRGIEIEKKTIDTQVLVNPP